MALCEVYRPYRGLGSRSDVPSRCASASASSARKRKADAVRHPVVPTRARSRRRRQHHGRIDDAVSFAQILESELLSYFKMTENSPRGEPAARENQDKPNGAMPQQDQASNDDDDVMEISLDEFLGSSAAHAVPPRAAQLESPDKLMVASSRERSSTSSALTDDDDDMCGLACPPMDDAYVELIFSEPLVQFDPAFIKEFVSDS